MFPILAQSGPITILTHDAFSLLALSVGLTIYYRALRARGWLDGLIVWPAGSSLRWSACSRLPAWRGRSPMGDKREL